MASLDVNIVIIALPTIGRELPQTSILDLLWVLIGYSLIISSVVVNFGRLSDMFGRVRLYNLGFAVFTAGSALCSISQTGLELIFFRMVQAIGAGFLFSNSTAIIVDSFPMEERGKALGINRSAQVVGSTLGLVIGGFLTAIGGWRAIFLVNIPIGIFAIIWSHYTLKELSVIEKGQKIDIFGNITFAGSLASLLAGISLYALGSLDLFYSSVLIFLGLASLAAFAIIERRVNDPMLDLTLFRSRAFSGGTLATFINALARGCVLLVMTAYLQGPTMGLGPLTAGIFLLPLSASLAFWGPISGWLSDKGGERGYATLGLLVTFTGFIWLAQLGPKSDFLDVAIPLILIGSGEGIFSAPNRASVMNSVPPEHRGVGGAVNTTMLSVGNTFSRAFSLLVMGLVLPAVYLQNLFAGTTITIGGESFLTSFLGALHLVFYVSAAFVAISIIPSILREPVRKKSVILEETSTDILDA